MSREKTATRCFEEMIAIGLKPNILTYNNLVQASSDSWVSGFCVCVCVRVCLLCCLFVCLLCCLIVLIVLFVCLTR